MNGKTCKKIKKFVDLLIANTPDDQRHKSRSEMIKEVKTFWHQGPKVKEFVNSMISEEKRKELLDINLSSDPNNL